MRFSFFAYKFFYYLEISLVYLFFILFIIFFLDLEGEDVCLEKRSPILAQRHIPKRYKIMLLTKGVEFATDVSTAIYIELMFDGIYEYRFVGFSGEDICKYDDNNLLTIYNENAGKHEIQLEDINDVFIFKKKIY